MAYIGKKPSDITRAIATYDSFTGDGSTTTFTLTQGAASANDITVVVNNVRQEPGTGSKSYTFTGPTTLTGTLPANAIAGWLSLSPASLFIKCAGFVETTPATL